MTQPRNQFPDEEAQMEALRRKLEQQSEGDYTLPSETRIVHEGHSMPTSPTPRRYADAPPAFIDPNKNASENLDADGASIVPVEPDNITPVTDVLMSPPQSVLGPHAATSTRETDDIKSQIRMLEERLGERGPSSLPNENTFTDSAGNETYYVKNITNRHISISGLGPEDGGGLSKIKVGTSVDLLAYAPIEDVKKNRTIRNLVYGVGPEKQLERLTERQYLEEKRRELANKERLDAMRKQETLKTQIGANPPQRREVLPHERTIQSFQTANKIRPVIESKIGKLALSYSTDPEVSALAMSPIDFIRWIQTEPLTHAEIEYILGDPAVSRNQNIKIALLEKKQQTPPS